MTTFTISPVDGPVYRTPVHTGQGHYLTVNFGTTVGDLDIAVMYYGDDDYTHVKGVDTDDTLTLSGRIESFRFTPDIFVPGSDIEIVHLPAENVMTVPSVLQSGMPGYERIRVDAGEPGFWAGRQFQFNREFTIPNAGQVVFRIDFDVETVIYESSVSIDTGTLYYRTFSSATDATPGGTFTQISNALSPLNSFSPSGYTPVNTVFTGGTITPGTDAPGSVQRLRVANATAQQSTISAGSGIQIGIPAGLSIYWVFNQLTGTSGTTTGTFLLRFEERGYTY